MITKEPTFNPEKFDATTAYRVAGKVVWNFFSDVSSKYIKTYEIPDIVQDAVIRAFCYYRSYNPASGKFSGWVGMIAFRVAYDFLQKRKRDFADIEFASGDWEKVDSSTPEQALLHKEQEESIERFRESFAPKDREFLEYMEDGLKPRQIAKKTGCNAGSVATRNCRIRKAVEKNFSYAV